MSEKFCIKRRCRSFIFAIRGIFTLLRTQHNMRIHLVATILVIGCGFFFHVTKSDWISLVIAITLVWITEALNTSVEFLCDQVTKEHQPLIGKSKDVAAASVLIASIGAVIIGAIVFIPYIL